MAQQPVKEARQPNGAPASSRCRHLLEAADTRYSTGCYDLGPIRHLYPFESHYLEVGGARMHYVDEGAGEPVVMLHGNPTWSFLYRNLICGLRDSHRVIAPDHVGCGLSDKPQEYPYRLATHIGNLEHLIDHLGLADITLAMHDWGGAIGCGYAVRHPNRVRRLIVFNTAAFFGRTPWRIRLCRLPLFGPVAVRGLNAFARCAIHMACSNRRRMTKDIRAGYLLPYDSYAHRVGILRFVQDIPVGRSHPTYSLIESIDAGLAWLRGLPVLICWGLRDFCFDEAFLAAWTDRFPEAEVHRFAEAGHYVIEDAGEQIMPIVRAFLGGGRSGGSPH